MTMRSLMLLFVTVLWVAQASAVPDKDDAPAQKVDTALLETALKHADAVFTAKIAKVTSEGQTNSIPPSTFGTVKFDEMKALKGEAPKAALRYSHREGMKNIDLTPKVEVLVVAKEKGVVAIVPATPANLALARKVLAASDKK